MLKPQVNTMTTKGYKLIQDNLGEYNILRKDNTLVCSEIQCKAEAELICDELNEVYQYYQELKTEYDRLHKVHGLLHDEHLDLEIERDKLKQETLELKEDNAILRQALDGLVEEFDDRISDKSPVRDLIRYRHKFYDIRRYIVYNLLTILDTFANKYYSLDAPNSAEVFCKLLNDYFNENNSLQQTNEQLKKQITDITFKWNKNHREFDKDTLYVKDNNTEIDLKNNNLQIKVFLPNECVRFNYFVTGRRLEKEMLIKMDDEND